MRGWGSAPDMGSARELARKALAGAEKHSVEGFDWCQAKGTCVSTFLRLTSAATSFARHR